MQAQYWSLNGLATQLRMDRRALARQLEGLRPAKEKKRKDGSTLRYWYLADVVEYLKRTPKEHGKHRRSERQQLFVKDMIEGIGQKLFPGMIEIAFPGLSGALVADAGLTKAQALRACELMTVCLLNGMSEVLGEPDMGFVIPPTLAEAREMGAERFIAEHWPD